MLKIRVKFLLIPISIFLVYQFVAYLQITNIRNEKLAEKLRVKHERNFTKKARLDNNHESAKEIHVGSIKKKQFQCRKSKEFIEMNQINDDYCDCKDGSDEFRTNACGFAFVECKYHNADKLVMKLLPKSRINDGICDCCDGSDEFKHIHLGFSLDREIQKKIGRYLSPCPKLC